jgi:hypothetical protein
MNGGESPATLAEARSASKEVALAEEETVGGGAHRARRRLLI